MINTVLNSVVYALDTKYNKKNQPKTIPIVTEDLHQNFPLPGFFVSIFNVSKDPLLGDRCMLDITVNIVYYPNEQNTRKKNDMNKIRMDLINLLTNIPLVNANLQTIGALRGFDEYSEIEENVLHFYISFKPIMCFSKTDDNSMNSVSKVVRAR